MVPAQAQNRWVSWTRISDWPLLCDLDCVVYCTELYSELLLNVKKVLACSIQHKTCSVGESSEICEQSSAINVQFFSQVCKPRLNAEQYFLPSWQPLSRTLSANTSAINPMAQVCLTEIVSADTQGRSGMRPKFNIFFACGFITYSYPSFGPGALVGLIQLALCGTLR